MNEMKLLGDVRADTLGNLRAFFLLSAACLFGSQAVAAGDLPQRFRAVCVESSATDSNRRSDPFQFDFQYILGQKTLCVMGACGENITLHSERFEFLCDSRYVDKPPCHDDINRAVIVDEPRPLYISYFFFEHLILLPSGDFTLEYERTPPLKNKNLVPMRIETEKGEAKGTCTIGPAKL
jgi:hypothetical protein